MGNFPRGRPPAAKEARSCALECSQYEILDWVTRRMIKKEISGEVHFNPNIRVCSQYHIWVTLYFPVSHEWHLSYIWENLCFFFNYILVYSPNFTEHQKHPEIVLSTFKQHCLYAKLSKSSFRCAEIEYLGHLISKNGVKADPNKLESMLNWPFPTTLKSLGDFFGSLDIYYSKFI